MQRLFVDTSAWFAYANRKDPQHESIGEIVRAFPGRLVTSNFVFDEAISLCLYRLGHSIARSVGAVLLDPDEIDIVRVTVEDEQAAWKLFGQRADQRFSFTDCTSFALMRRLGLDEVLALDEDFRTMGFSLVP